MGYSTHYLGYLTIDPPLNPAETEWLRAFAEWGGGPGGADAYDVPDNPRAAWSRAVAARTAAIVPHGVRDWVVSVDGSALRWREQEKSNDAVHAIRFLIEHYLAPGAHARASGRDVFESFTFDHHVNGVIAAENGGSGELFLLRLSDNAIRHQTVVPGASLW